MREKRYLKKRRRKKERQKRWANYKKIAKDILRDTADGFMAVLETIWQLVLGTSIVWIPIIALVVACVALEIVR